MEHLIAVQICIVGMAVTEVIGLCAYYQTSAVTEKPVGTEFGEIAQHQTNIIGPDGPVYTKQLEVYEKVETPTNGKDSSLTTVGKLYLATPCLSFSGLQQDVRPVLLPSSLLRVSALLIR